MADPSAKNRTVRFSVTIETKGAGHDADLVRVEELLALHIQDLLYDEEFTSALQPEEFISSTVTPILGKENG
jgi:hypothetical protein